MSKRLNSFTVEFHENNSGGRFRLTEKNYRDLVKAGWKMEYQYTYTKQFTKMSKAIKEWEKITGKNHNERGCECCGPPFTFNIDGTYKAPFISGDLIHCNNCNNTINTKLKKYTFTDDIGYYCPYCDSHIKMEKKES